MRTDKHVQRQNDGLVDNLNPSPNYMLFSSEWIAATRKLDSFSVCGLIGRLGAILTTGVVITRLELGAIKPGVTSFPRHDVMSLYAAHHDLLE